MERKGQTKYNLFSDVSAISLLTTPLIFGFASRPVEMGLAIVASSLGLVFSNLEKYSKFKGAGFEAEIRSDLIALVESGIERDPDEIRASNSRSDFTSAELSILKVFFDSKYVWRTHKGISRSADINEKEAWPLLAGLAEKRILQIRNRNNDGKMLWSLTENGRIKLQLEELIKM